MGFKFRGIINSFNGGELSRRMEGRTDTAIYAIGVSEMLNFVPTVEGPTVKRSGFRFVKAAAASSSFLSRFIFSITQSYVLEWSDLAVRFFTNGGQIESSPGVPYQVTVPYTAAEAPAVSMQQSFDRLYLAHENHPPASLDRLTATTFSYAELELQAGPFKDINTDPDYFFMTTGATGTININGIGGTFHFHADHIGSAFYIEADDFNTIPAWEPGYDGVAIGDMRRSDGKVYKALTAGRTGYVQPTHNHGSEYDGATVGNDVAGNAAGGVKWEFLHDNWGWGIITAVADANHCTLLVKKRIPDVCMTQRTSRWAFAAFSKVEGWPHLVWIWNGRLMFLKGLELYGSVAGDYLNFAERNEIGERSPDMAFRRVLAYPDKPHWVKADQRILLGTPTGELGVGPIDNSQVASGDNLSALPQSNYGSMPVWPVEIGTSTLFVQRGARRIREAEYEFQRDRFVAQNITVWARHITSSGINQLAFQQEPEEMLWAVRNDGLLAAHPHAPEQEIKGFSRVQLAANGKVLSAVSIPSADGTNDELWILRDRDGARAIEYLSQWWLEGSDLADAFFVDSGVSYDGAPQQVFSTGLSHLEGRAVAILADGSVVTGKVVSGGSVDIGFAASKVHIGLGYEARLKPLRPEARDAPGGNTIQGIKKKLVRLALRVIDTVGINLSVSADRLEPLIDRPASAPMDAPIPPINGDTAKSIGGPWNLDGQATIISNDPLPCIITAIMPTIEVEGES